MSKAQAVSRWFVLASAIAVSLIYLNSAVYRAWLAGGPPNSNPEGWLFSSVNYLCIAGAFALGGVALFTIIGQLPSLSKKAIVLLVIAAFVGIIPFAREFVARDACLDGGGQWSNSELRCVH